MRIGDKVYDCFLCGYGSRDSICNEGMIEHIGRDYVIVRDIDKDKPIMVNLTITELTKLIHNEENT